ncbi:MAG: radical SAM protein [Pseudomonadota bacterium]
MEDFGPSGLVKFADPSVTASGEPRARVVLNNPKTLWFNTGTLCNIACSNCYIESSPHNDALVYISADEVADYLDQIEARAWPVTEIGFTGGEPFLNPQMIEMARRSLERGFEVIILTNAMRPMMRPAVQLGLIGLAQTYGPRLTLRISLDHWSPAQHDTERGKGGFESSLTGMRWLGASGIRMTVAARSIWGEAEHETRLGFAELFRREGFAIDASDPAELVIFPEMDINADVPEITTACWGLLGKRPQDMMCATSRMVVKRKGAPAPTVVACTLLPYEPEFELGPDLADAEGSVALNHPHCAKFCVLGGASCSA